MGVEKPDLFKQWKMMQDIDRILAEVAAPAAAAGLNLESVREVLLNMLSEQPLPIDFRNKPTTEPRTAPVGFIETPWPRSDGLQTFRPGPSALRDSFCAPDFSVHKLKNHPGSAGNLRRSAPRRVASCPKKRKNCEPDNLCFKCVSGA